MISKDSLGTNRSHDNSDQWDLGATEARRFLDSIKPGVRGVRPKHTPSLLGGVAVRSLIFIAFLSDFSHPFRKIEKPQSLI
jgi:hypothetical protein